MANMYCSMYSFSLCLKLYCTYLQCTNYILTFSYVKKVDWWGRVLTLHPTYIVCFLLTYTYKKIPAVVGLNIYLHVKKKTRACFRTLKMSHYVTFMVELCCFHYGHFSFLKKWATKTQHNSVVQHCAYCRPLNTYNPLKKIIPYFSSFFKLPT